jgi:hypothetical protein
LAARGRQSTIVSFIYSRWDFNRDGTVDNADVLAAKANQTASSTSLQLIAPPTPPAPAAAPQAVALKVLTQKSNSIAVSAGPKANQKAPPRPRLKPAARQPFKPTARPALPKTDSNVVTLPL